MPRLTPAELQAARRRSGRLGGRPRKPTVEEARQAALAELVPQALRVLRAHLGEGNNANPDAWRAALKVFEHAFGSPPGEIEEVRMPRSVDEVDQLSWDELLRALEYIQDDELASSAIAPPKALPLRASA